MALQKVTCDFRNRRQKDLPKEIKIVDLHKFLNQTLANSIVNENLALPEVNRWLDGIKE